MRKTSNAKTRQTGWREKAGLPVLVCPACYHDGQHWVPDSLKGPGYFTCEGRDELEDAVGLFELDQ